MVSERSATVCYRQVSALEHRLNGMHFFYRNFCFAYLFVCCFPSEGGAISQAVITASRRQVLPSALHYRVQLKKVQQFLNDPAYFTPTGSEVINFERNSVNYGAISESQFNQLRGNYFSFFWRTPIKTNITVRFEYRQNALGNKIHTLERDYPHAYGSYQSKFQVIGNDYLQFGRVIAWRVLLLEEGKIVAIRQSFLWPDSSE